MDLDAKEKLRRLKESIAGLMDQERIINPAVWSISPEVGEWFVGEVEKFISGKEPDLEKALGLTRGRGRPRLGASAKNYERAKKVFEMLSPRDGKPAATKDEILDEFPDADWGDLQDEQKRYGRDIWAEFAEGISAKINARIAAGPPRRPLGIK
jgi:hypothetical protein